jgi:hypothetical protein
MRRFQAVGRSATSSSPTVAKGLSLECARKSSSNVDNQSSVGTKEQNELEYSWKLIQRLWLARFA